MLGDPRVALDVVTMSSHDNPVTLVKKSVTNQNFWNRLTIPLISNSSFQVGLVVESSPDVTDSTIAIDDLVFSSGCHHLGTSMPLPSNPVSTVTPGPVDCG